MLWRDLKSFSSFEIASAGLKSAAGVEVAEQPQCCPCSDIGGLHCLSSLVSFPYLFSWPMRDGGVILESGARVLFMTY